ncbi:MAG TPA: helix-turn-helix transcriptional regulator [Actinopolymorphaceae bacterium]
MTETRGGPRPRRRRSRPLEVEVDVQIDPDTPVYVISVAAELTGLHPQTLRTYDRLGLVSPGRTGGGGRLYSMRDIETLRHVTTLTAEGIGLEGVRRILELENEIAHLRARLAKYEQPSEPVEHNPFALERLPRTSTAVVLWQRGRRR